MGVAVSLLLQPAMVQAQVSSLPSCGDAAVANPALADAAVSDAAAADAGDAGPSAASDAQAPQCPPISPPADDAGPVTPSGPAEPGYTRDPRPLDPMLADPPPFVEPPYAGRDPDPSPNEPPAARVDAVDDTDHSQACGCRFAGSGTASPAALVAPLFGLLLLARRKLRCVSR